MASAVRAAGAEDLIGELPEGFEQLLGTWFRRRGWI